MKTDYRVTWYIDDIYQVLDRASNMQLYKGSLSDCETWIRLHEGGYFNL